MPALSSHNTDDTIAKISNVVTIVLGALIVLFEVAGISASLEHVDVHL
jgi:hypothetical protein